MNNAQQSQNQSDDKNIELDAQQMNRISNAINAAINKGLYQCMIYETIRKPNITYLRNAGYNITEMGGRMGENNYLLKWPNTQHISTDIPYSGYYPGGSPVPHYPL